MSPDPQLPRPDPARDPARVPSPALLLDRSRAGRVRSGHARTVAGVQLIPFEGWVKGATFDVTQCHVAYPTSGGDVTVYEAAFRGRRCGGSPTYGAI